MMRQKILILSFGLISLFTLNSCDGDTLRRILAALFVDMTDAPVDDPLYSDVYLTIAALEVNGEEVKEFNGPMTLNISDLRNGLSAELVNTEVAAGSYDEISLVLDFDEDEQGQFPGCYVNTIYDRKIDLGNGRGGTETITLQRALDLQENEEVKLMIDFDLRKTIRSSRPGDESELVLINNDELANAIRLLRVEETGDVQINLTAEMSNQLVNRFIVYAYEPGTFNPATERFDTDGDGITFENAVTSNLVDMNSGTNANVGLYYLEAGEYDLVVEAYEQVEFSALPTGMLALDQNGGLTQRVSVDAQGVTNLSLSSDTLVE